MKKHPDIGGKARAWRGWHKHLRKDGKRMANKAARRANNDATRLPLAACH